MDFEQVKYEVQGTTAIITLNRPERRNALSAQLLRELNAALLEADEYNPVHAVILRGAGPHFCAGADLNEYSSGRGPDYRGRVELALVPAEEVGLEYKGTPQRGKNVLVVRPVPRA